MTYVVVNRNKVASVERSGTSSASATHTAAQSSLTQLTLTRTVTDHSDGSGNLFGTYGTVLYPTKTVNLKVVGDFTESTYQTAYETADAFSPASGAAGSTSGSQKGGETGSQTFKEVYAANSLVVRYKTGAGVTESHS
uniref:hypothetical protein n=1 Tax=Thauera butanivorans TaxID=86174 RepID=UPI000AF2C437